MSSKDSHLSDPQRTKASTNAGPLHFTSGRLTASVQSMQNYVQGEVVPATNFEALQIDDGHTLLFTCDTSGVLYAIEETSGESHTGWRRHDLSTKPIAVSFPGKESQAKVRTFGVGLDVWGGCIGLMIAVSLGGNDHLFISLRNSTRTTSWLTDPSWIMLPFDPTEEPQNITILGALFAEIQGEQHLIVDISQSSTNTLESFISRYRIDPSRANGYYWVKHDVVVDISGGEHQSVVGRIDGARVDGIYTAGHVEQSAQLVYMPVINLYYDGPSVHTRLRLPGGRIPSAITTVRNLEGFSDLYAVAGSTLYRLPADKQRGDFEPTALVSSDIITDTDTLRGTSYRGEAYQEVTTIWGRNRSGQVYYLACEITRLWDPKAWTKPLPILSGVKHISSYLNRNDGGNTILTAGNGRLKKFIQHPVSLGGTWRSQDIIIDAPGQACRSTKSYTTTIRVTEKEKDVPAPNSTVMLSTRSRTPVYINGIYYVLSPKALPVTTDMTGCLTIIDSTESLHGAVLVASLNDSTSITINPMDLAIAKLTAFNSVSKLRDASFPNKTISGSPELSALVEPSTSDDDLSAAVFLLGTIREAYMKLQGPGEKGSMPAGTALKSLHNTVAPLIFPASVRFLSWGDVGHRLGGVVDDIEKVLGALGETVESLAGDIFNAIQEGAEAAGRIIKDTATNTLHFVAKIGGTVYHAVLDTVHAVIGATEWLYNQIKTNTERLMAFLENSSHGMTPVSQGVPWDEL